jgi:hypothetical protein
MIAGTERSADWPVVARRKKPQRLGEVTPWLILTVHFVQCPKLSVIVT